MSKQTAANNSLLAQIKREFNHLIFKHASALVNECGDGAAIEYVQRYQRNWLPELVLPQAAPAPVTYTLNINEQQRKIIERALHVYNQRCHMPAAEREELQLMCTMFATLSAEMPNELAVEF